MPITVLIKKINKNPGQLGYLLRFNEEVFGLDVSVNNVISMAVLDSL